MVSCDKLEGNETTVERLVRNLLSSLSTHMNEKI
jgi:hypothetical protein